MAELPIATQCGTGAPAAPPLDSRPVSGYGFPPRIGVRGMLLIAGITMALRRPHKGMKRGPGIPPIVCRFCPSPPLWTPAFAGVTLGSARWQELVSRVGAGVYFHSNRSCRLLPAHQGVKTRSCDLEWRVGTVDSATPHSDPSGGQAPALHFLVPPSIIGLQFATFRPGRAGIEVDWGAHPGSESGTCFRTNDESGDLFSYQ